MTRKFEPWKRDRQSGIKLAACGICSGVFAAGFGATGIYEAAAVLGVTATALTGAGLSRMKRAANRAFGKAFEVEFTQRALAKLSAYGIQAHANVMARGIGDIDLVVHAGGRNIPVEIKSFRKWNQLFIFKGEREARALKQADRQRLALNSVYGVVWVPQGSPTLLQRFLGAGWGLLVFSAISDGTKS